MIAIVQYILGIIMSPFQRILFIVYFGISLLTLTVSACTPQGESETPQQRTVVQAERALLMSKIVVEKVHRILWSDSLRLKIIECKGKPNVVLCMGHFTPENNEKIVKGLKSYSDLALIAGEAVLNESPRLLELVNNCVDAAIRLIDLIPNSQLYIDQLRNVRALL